MALRTAIPLVWSYLPNNSWLVHCWWANICSFSVFLGEFRFSAGVLIGRASLLEMVPQWYTCVHWQKWAFLSSVMCTSSFCTKLLYWDVFGKWSCKVQVHLRHPSYLQLNKITFSIQKKLQCGMLSQVPGYSYMLTFYPEQGYFLESSGGSCCKIFTSWMYMGVIFLWSCCCWRPKDSTKTLVCFSKLNFLELWIN